MLSHLVRENAATLVLFLYFCILISQIATKCRSQNSFWVKKKGIKSLFLVYRCRFGWRFPSLFSSFSSKADFKNSWTNFSQKYTAYRNGGSGHSLISVFKRWAAFFIVHLGLSLPKEADDLFASVFLPPNRPVFPKYIWDAILVFWEKSQRSSQGVVKKKNRIYW